MGNLSKKVGRRIKQLRESLKIKQFELAEMLDMEPSNLTRIESGYQMPKEENLVKIAGILGVKEKDLFDFGEEQNKEELIQKINSLLEQCDKPELEYIYNSITPISLNIKTASIIPAQYANDTFSRFIPSLSANRWLVISLISESISKESYTFSIARTASAIFLYF